MLYLTSTEFGGGDLGGHYSRCRQAVVHHRRWGIEPHGYLACA